MNQNIKAVIFDLDGTLIDTEKYYMEAWPASMKEFGYTMTYEQALTMRSLGRPFAPKHLAQISGDPNFDYSKIRSFRKDLMEKIIEERGIPLKPYAVETLQGLQNKGITVALGTANDYERATRYLNKIGLLPYFDKIICANMVKQGKPAPDLYQYAVEQLGLSKEECLVVEDSPNGVNSAYGAGLKVVMIPDLTQPEPELLPHIYKVYDSLESFYQTEFQ